MTAEVVAAAVATTLLKLACAYPCSLNTTPTLVDRIKERTGEGVRGEGKHILPIPKIKKQTYLPN